ncbi:unnamed protein product [Amoebophrya sp. A120]|nr:unnamed protein product [Amoebophrya sp. A120]|eukprot:GSA120T00015327001.1
MTLLFNPELEDALADIEEGDAIVFNATILGLGIRGSPHVLQLWKIVAHRRAPALIAQAASHTDQEADGGGPRGSGQLDGGLRRGDPLSLQATPSTFGVSDQDQGHGRGGDASASSSMTGKQSREQPARLGSLDEGRKNAGAAGRGEKSPLSAAAVTGDPQLALTATHSPPLSTKEEGHERPGSRPVWTVNEQQRNEIPGAASSPARQTSNSEALRHGGDGSNDET